MRSGVHSRSVNTVLGVGDCPGGSWWRCVAAPSRLRGYVGDGVDGMTRGRNSFGGEDGGTMYMLRPAASVRDENYFPLLIFSLEWSASAANVPLNIIYELAR
jgi:hypothetical protein